MLATLSVDDYVYRFCYFLALGFGAGVPYRRLWELRIAR